VLLSFGQAKKVTKVYELLHDNSMRVGNTTKKKYGGE
jgi:hypothetical protein